MNQRIDCQPDRLTCFAQMLSGLSPWHPRRFGLHLAQFGILLTVGSFCISIVGMNIGLIASLVGCLVAGAPLHRLTGFRPILLLTALLAASTIAQQNWNEFVKTAALPLGLLTAQVALHVAVPWSARLRHVLLVALCVSVALSICLAIGQYIIGRGNNRPFHINASGPRFYQSSGFFSLHLTQGAMMGMLFFVVGAFTHDVRPRLGWIIRIANTIGVIISGARSALLGFTTAVVMSALVRGRKFAVAALLGGITVLVGGLMVLHATSPGRFNNLISFKDGRWPIWRTTLAMIGERPWLGTGGTDEYREIFRNRYPEVVPDIPAEFPQGAPHAHNTQLAHAAEHGIPFAIAWLILLCVPGWELARRRHFHPQIFQAALGLTVMALVFGQFEKFDGECSRILWASLGLLLALSTHSSRSSGPTNQPAESPGTVLEDGSGKVTPVPMTVA